MSNIKDYAGRLVDAAAFQLLLPAEGVQLLVQELATHRDGGSVIAGIQKLVQRILLTLLTIKGTRKYQPALGCQFMLDAISGGWRTVADVTQSFLLARSDVRNQLILEETTDDPDDERYGGMTLDRVTLSERMVTVHISVRSLAGDAYTFLVPLKVAIR